MYNIPPTSIKFKKFLFHQTIKQRFLSSSTPHLSEVPNQTLTLCIIDRTLDLANIIEPILWSILGLVSNVKLKQCFSWTCTIVLFSRHTLHCICNLAMSSQFIIIDHKLPYGNGMIVIVCHLSVPEPLYLHYVKTAAWPDLLCKVHSAKCQLDSPIVVKKASS